MAHSYAHVASYSDDLTDGKHAVLWFNGRHDETVMICRSRAMADAIAAGMNR